MVKPTTSGKADLQSIHAQRDCVTQTMHPVVLQEMTDVTLLDASLVELPSHHRSMNWTQEIGVSKYTHATGFSFKAYALAFVTTFDEVLVLDSDNLPLQNPEGLFSSPQYLNKGSSFWPDWWQRSRTQQIPFWLDVDPFAYNTFGLAAPWEVSTHPMTATESGTMMLDRSAYPSASCNFTKNY